LYLDSLIKVQIGKQQFSITLQKEKF